MYRLAVHSHQGISNRKKGPIQLFQYKRQTRAIKRKQRGSSCKGPGLDLSRERAEERESACLTSSPAKSTTAQRRLRKSLSPVPLPSFRLTLAHITASDLRPIVTTATLLRSTPLTGTVCRRTLPSLPPVSIHPVSESPLPHTTPALLTNFRRGDLQLHLHSTRQQYHPSTTLPPRQSPLTSLTFLSAVKLHLPGPLPRLRRHWRHTQSRWPSNGKSASALSRPETELVTLRPTTPHTEGNASSCNAYAAP